MKRCPLVASGVDGVDTVCTQSLAPAVASRPTASAAVAVMADVLEIMAIRFLWVEEGFVIRVCFR
jgi:hypothetical protein